MTTADGKKKLVGRHKRVAFMDATGDGKNFTRMTGFTSMSDGKNATEYSRQYVDEASERSDVVGYAPSVDYEFDLYTNDPVQARIAEITDDELLHLMKEQFENICFGDLDYLETHRLQS